MIAYSKLFEICVESLVVDGVKSYSKLFEIEYPQIRNRTELSSADTIIFVFG